MDINRANMEVFFQNLSNVFAEQFNNPPANMLLNEVAMSVPSTGAQTVHGWLTQVPWMREWIGDRQAKNIASQKLTIVNRLFEDTVEIPRVDIEDDLHLNYLNNVRWMANAALAFKEQLMVEAMLRGASDLWADGIAIYSAAGRKLDGTNAIANYTTDNLDAAGTKLNTAYAAMRSYLGNQGKPLNVIPKYLVHGPLLRARAVTLIESQYAALLAADGTSYVGGQITNPNYGLVKRVESPFLINGFIDSKGTTYNAGYYWFLLGEVAGIRGLCWQIRKDPEAQMSRAQLDSDFVFATDKFQFGSRMRGEGFITFPFLTYAGFGTA